MRYRTLNPVRVKLVGRAADWRWSSAAAHLSGRDDGVVKVAPALERIGDFTAFLDAPIDGDLAYATLRGSEGTGRPIGAAAWPGSKPAPGAFSPARSRDAGQRN